MPGTEKEDPVVPPVPDLADKTYKTALQVSDLAGKLMATIRQFDAVITKGVGGGVTFVGFDLSNTDLKFCSGDDIANACQAAVDLKAFLESSFRDDVFDKVSAPLYGDRE